MCIYPITHVSMYGAHGSPVHDLWFPPPPSLPEGAEGLRGERHGAAVGAGHRGTNQCTGEPWVVSVVFDEGLYIYIYMHIYIYIYIHW